MKARGPAPAPSPAPTGTLASPAPPTRSERALGRPLRLLTRRLHILMIGWEFPPHIAGGLGVHSFELVRELTAMGHRITFLVPTPGEYTPVPGVRFAWPTKTRYRGRLSSYDHPPPQEAGDLLSVVAAYNRWIGGLPADETIDVIHLHDWFGTVGGLQLARRLHRPVVLTIHSTEHDRSLGQPWTEILEREKVGLTGADRVITVSQRTKDQLVELYGVPAARVRVVYNAVRPSERVAQVDPSRPTVLFLGRLALMKGVDTFLQAAARVAPRHPEALFIVAGEGPEFPHLLETSARLGISDRVLFLGRVTEEERTVLLARTSVFVLPSVSEPFGIAALEAMAAGIPTILSKTSGVAEMVGAVFAVDFWDVEEFASRIAELLAYPALRETMRSRGREEATAVGWAERALETASVYAELVAQEAGHR
jgi:glycogen(starch) synthase